MLLISHAKVTAGWALIQANFDPIQEIGPKVGVGALSRVGTLSYDSATSKLTVPPIHLVIQTYVSTPSTDP